MLEKAMELLASFAQGLLTILVCVVALFVVLRVLDRMDPGKREPPPEE